MRPGDTLRVTAEVVAAHPSRSKPDRGVATIRYQTANQRGEVVMTMLGHQLLRRRPA